MLLKYPIVRSIMVLLMYEISNKPQKQKQLNEVMSVHWIDPFTRHIISFCRVLDLLEIKYESISMSGKAFHYFLSDIKMFLFSFNGREFSLKSAQSAK